MSDKPFCAGLEELFALRLAQSRDFRAWVLSRTKFCRLWPLARLMLAEQRDFLRQDPWWRNWGPEGDDRIAARMLFLFEVEPTKLRFALHVESAVRSEDLGASEQGVFRRTAQAMMDQDRFLDHMDFETVLLAPQELIVSDARTLNFDRRIPFEAIAGFLPQFGSWQNDAA
jgi:hypothetical protein